MLTTPLNGIKESHTSKCIAVESDDTRNHVREYCQKIHDDNVKGFRRKLHEDFRSNITLHGYRQLVSETGWRRLSWILVMTILTSFAIYLFFQMLIDYGYKTVIEYEEEDGLTKMEYPTVTICSNSPAFNEKSLKRFPVDVTIEEFKRFYIEELSSLNYRYNRSSTSSKILKNLFLQNITSYKDISELVENTIFDATDVWRQFINGPICYFGQNPCNLTTDFKQTLHWKYSLCHQWNYYDMKNISRKQTTIDEKLTLLLNIHTNYKLVSYYPFYGIILFVHPYGTPHYLTPHTESMGLQTGLFTSINIGLKEVTYFSCSFWLFIYLLSSQNIFILLAYTHCNI